MTLTLADHAHEWRDMVAHIGTLTRLASEASTVVELGVRGGVSTWALLDGLPADGQLVSVDWDRQVRSIVPARVREDPRWTLILGNDRTTRIQARLPLADLVFIDTSHEYHHTLEELALSDRLGARVIALHDYDLDDVHDAADGYVRRHAEFSLTGDDGRWGLAVLRR